MADKTGIDEYGEFLIYQTDDGQTNIEVKINRQVERQIPYYNLDMMISLGYRIKSVIATRFRQWATQRLKS